MIFDYREPAEYVSYLACPRCGLIVLQGSDENGSPLCPDCREEDETVVKMDLVAASDRPPT